MLDEEHAVEALVLEALKVLPPLASALEIIVVDDGSRDRTAAIAERLAQKNALVRVIRHPQTLGYGAALRSGFRAARYEVIGFLDGDGQFRVEALGALVSRLAAPDQPDAVFGERVRRADSKPRSLLGWLYRTLLRALFGLRLRDVDCGCKVFRREALRGLRVESDGAFFSAELCIKLAGARAATLGVPHHPRLAGRATGARAAVIWRALRDLGKLRLSLWLAPELALRSGESILLEESAQPSFSQA